MSERPILFSAPMVRAVLDGSKTQTRRVMRGVNAPSTSIDCDERGVAEISTLYGDGPGYDVHEAVTRKTCPYGQPGDRLWVRETWQTHCDKDGITPRDLPMDSHVQYPATYDGWVSKKRPSIHMPRWASRINLEITGVRVERLQDISEDDAKAEGCERLQDDEPGYMEREKPDWKLCPQCGGTRLYTAYGPNGGACFDTDCTRCDTYAKRYRHLWESLNGAGSWDANPWVWAIEFKSGMDAA